MKPIGTGIGLITLAAALAAVPAAQAGPGLSGAQLLLANFSARPAGMADAGAALSGSLATMPQNPAGLAGLPKAEIMFVHQAGIEGRSTEWLTGAVPVPGLGTLGAQALYCGQPPIDNNVADEPTVEVKDMLFDLSFARPVAAGVEAGFNAKVLSQTLGSANALVLALDLGAQYALDEQTRFGLALRNIGTPVKFKKTEDPLPTSVCGGAALEILPGAGNHSLTGALDVEYQVPEQNLIARAGAEYLFKKQMALRVGYAYSADTMVGGLTAGVGFRFRIETVEMVLDYALQPQVWEASDFEMENLVSLGVKF